MTDVLSQYNASDVNHFHHDIVQLARVSKEVDRFYAEWHTDMDKYLSKYKRWVADFSKKYKGITIKVVQKIDSIRTRFFLHEESISKVFENAASKIVGLKSAGIKKFGVADVSDSQALIDQVNNAKSQLHLTYFDPDIGTRSVYLSYDAHEKKVELHYDHKEFVIKNNPEFRIACFYALKEGIDKDINLHDEGATFGFDSLLSEREKAEWQHMLNPEFTE